MKRNNFTIGRVALTNRLRVSCSSLGSNRATREMRQLSAVLLALIFLAASPHVLRAQEAVSTTGGSGTTSSTSAPSSATTSTELSTETTSAPPAVTSLHKRLPRAIDADFGDFGIREQWPQ